MKTAVLLLIGIALAASSVIAVMNNGNASRAPLAGIKTDKTAYSLGAPVVLSFTVENNTTDDMVIRFSSGKQYDFWVVKDGNEVWRWSKGKVFTQALVSITLKPGERKVYEATWNQRGNDGKQIPPGSYDLYAQLATMGPKPTPVTTQANIGTGRTVVASTTVGGIAANAESSVGRIVSISGICMGWQPDPNSELCKNGPPVSRADWAISDKTGCIFVHGQSSLDPASDRGKKVAVVGTVRKTDKGQIYIESQKVTLAQ
jgi:hypothetical protein